MGPSHYPFVRSIGGVSLFDFRAFDEKEYASRYPSSTWGVFVPCCIHRDSRAIWIEIDFQVIHNGFLDGPTVVRRWKDSGELQRKIMPVIEATHIGPIEVNAFKRVLSYDTTTRAFTVVERQRA